MSESRGEWDDDLEDTALPTEPAEEDSDKPELFYPTVAEFVSNKLATSYRRQLNVQGGVTWCPQWWKHAEATSAASKHSGVLRSTYGPFKGCSPDDGHRAKLTPLPCQ